MVYIIRLHKDKTKELDVRVAEAKKQYGVALQKYNNQKKRRLQKTYKMIYIKHMHELSEQLIAQNKKVFNILTINILD